MNEKQSAGGIFVEAARGSLAEGMEKIEHCLVQLPESELSWRPFEGANSLTNIVLHLCGNMRQWIISGVGGAKDVRNRPAEFTDRRAIAKAELLEKLRATVCEADTVLAKLTPDELVAPRRIQGFETNVLTAVFDTIAHFRGHTQEIIYITRMRLGDQYKFHWQPQGKEQGAV